MSVWQAAFIVWKASAELCTAASVPFMKTPSWPNLCSYKMSDARMQKTGAKPHANKIESASSLRPQRRTHVTMHLTCLSALQVPAFSELGYCDLNPLCNAYRLTESLRWWASWIQWIAFGISHFAAQTHAKVWMHTHIHTSTRSPPEQSDKAALSEKKGARGEGGGCSVIMAFTKSLLCHRLKCLLGEH